MGIEAYVLIYALATADYRGGAATGHPEFTTQARCEAAADKIRQEVAAHHAAKQPGWRSDEMHFKSAIAFCVPK